MLLDWNPHYRTKTYQNIEQHSTGLGNFSSDFCNTNSDKYRINLENPRHGFCEEGCHLVECDRFNQNMHSYRVMDVGKLW